MVYVQIFIIDKFELTLNYISNILIVYWGGTLYYLMIVELSAGTEDGYLPHYRKINKKIDVIQQSN